MFRYKFELNKACLLLVRDMLKLKPGETFVVLGDTESDPQVVEGTASAAFAVGAKPMVIWVETPLGSHKSADPFLPSEGITAALKAADASVSFNYRSISYSETLMTALNENKNTRHMVCSTMNADTLVRLFGRVDIFKLKEFIAIIFEMTKNAKVIRQTTPAGGDIEFCNAKTLDGQPDPNHPIGMQNGDAGSPGIYFPLGQIGWAPEIESINGTIVCDGLLHPPCGLLDDPVHLTITSGKITKVMGGPQAVQFEDWLKKFNHQQMYGIAHATYGYNPGAVLNKDILEGERIWGSTCWGFGAIGPNLIKPNGVEGPEHTDGICLNTSVWLDGNLVQDKGRQVIPELKKLEEELLSLFKN